MIVAKRNETREMFQKNLQLLTPWHRETVLQVDEKELWKKVEIVYNDQGFPLCSYHDENVTFRITSEKPIQEAERWGKTISGQGTGVIFLFGSGFGYPLFEIFNNKKPHTLVVLFEQDIYLFTAMLHHFDFEPIVKTQKIAFLIGDIENFTQAFDQLFFSMFFVSCTFPTLAFTHIVQRNFKAHYIKIFKYTFSLFELYAFYIGNDHLDTLIGFKNMLANIKEVINNPNISCLKDKYKDVPAFIIANGPSLDKNIQQLKKIQDKGLIICGESAIIPLMKNNIKPNILTVLERTKYTYTYHFENIDYPEDISLLCLALIDKQVFPSFPGSKIPIFRKGEAINEWMNKHIGDGSAIDAGANVSHLAFELAIYLGANPIVFIGQDYAYGPEGVTHSKDAVYNEEKGKRAIKILRSRPIVYVESNDGEMIASNKLWVDFKLGLERKIASYSEKLILNATEGGAKIKGTKCVKLNDVIDKYCIKPIPYHVNEIISENKAKLSVPEKKENLVELIKSIEKYAKQFRNMRHKAIEGKLVCKEMIRLSLDKDSGNNRAIFEDAYQKNIKAFQLFISDGLFRCFTQQTFLVYYYMMSRQGTVDTPNKITDIFRIHHAFFHHLNLVSQSVAVHLENAIEPLESILKDMENDKVKG